jgi:hypothetical protein
VRFLLDSCILIDHLRGHEAATAFLVAERAAAISAITRMEVMAGADEREAEVIRGLLEGFALLAIDGAVAEEAVRLRRERRLKVPDAIILATARVHHLALATRNTRDFHRSERGVVVPYELR